MIESRNIGPVGPDRCRTSTGYHRQKYFCPGFIDVHTHDDRVCIDKPDMQPKISQGVTTVVVGNCGLSLAPLICNTNPVEPLNLLGGKTEFEFGDFSKLYRSNGAGKNLRST